MKNLTAVLALMAAATGVFAASVTLQPLTSFGNGDGWLAPNENGYGWLGIPADGINPALNLNLARGLDYNPATGNLIVVARLGAVTDHVKVVDGATGVLEGQLPVDTTLVTGGTFFLNMVGVTSDGVIYIGNLQTTAANPFRVYRWESEAAAAPTLAGSIVFPGSVRTRTGDAFDLMGSGVLTQICAGGGSSTPGYATLSTADGSTFTGVHQDPAGAHVGAFRLGITFSGPDSVWGKQPGTQVGVGPFPLQRSTFFPTLSNDGTSVLPTGTAPVDFAVVDGIPVLAALDVNSSLVLIYTLEDIANPTLRASFTTTSGTLMANGNGTGSVKIVNISGNTATIYAMSSNQGIQAMTMSISPSISVSGRVTLEGRAPASGVLNGLTLNVQLRQGGSTIESRTVTLDDDGDFSFETPVAPGVYDIWMKRPVGHLGVITTGVDLSGGSATFNPAVMRGGDSSADNNVNLDDFLMLAAEYEAAPPSNLDSDYTGDGIVNIDDFLILASNYEGAPGDD